MTDNPQLISSQRAFAGTQSFYSHQSDLTQTKMNFSIYLPDKAKDHKLPVLWYLSGLTCTADNFTTKSGMQAHASKHELIVVAADTSPRGAGVDGEDDSYDLGTGASFYVDACKQPWKRNYQMFSYITRELRDLVLEYFPVRVDAQSIFGHSMGGHGALVLALRHPELYQSVSALSPICNPSKVPWGINAFKAYLGDDEQAWSEYDACQLITAGHSTSRMMLIDQGDADEFINSQLLPRNLQKACSNSRQELRMRIQSGYDHSYYFVASFIADHFEFHAEILNDMV